jgi:hypothetical protein
MIPYFQNHILKVFKMIRAQRLPIRTLQKTLERLNCKYTRLVKEWGHCKLSSTFGTWLPCKTSVSHRIISPSLLQLWLRWTSIICWDALLYLQCLKAKGTRRHRLNGHVTLSTPLPFE